MENFCFFRNITVYYSESVFYKPEMYIILLSIRKWSHGYNGQSTTDCLADCYWPGILCWMKSNNLLKGQTKVS